MFRCLWSILLLVAFVSAQAPAGVPTCAKAAIEQAIKSSGCAASDKTCICKSEQVSSAIDVASEACNETDQDALFAAISALCDDGTQVVEEPDVEPAAEPAPVAESPAPQEQPQSTEDAPAPVSTPTIASENTNQAQFSTPIVIASALPNPTELPSTTVAPTTQVTTASTSQATDTRELSRPSIHWLDDDEDPIITPVQDGTNPDQADPTFATTTSLPQADGQAQPSTSATGSNQNPANQSPHSASPDFASPGSTSQSSTDLLSGRPGSTGPDATGAAAHKAVAGIGSLILTTVICWIVA